MFGLFMHAAQSSFGDPAFAQLQRTGIMMDETVDQHAVNPVKNGFVPELSIGNGVCGSVIMTCCNSNPRAQGRIHL